MGRHQSLDSHVKKSLAWLKTLPGVAKIVIGISESCRHRFAPGFIRFKLDVEGGIKINAYSGNGVTDLFIKIDPLSERENVKNALRKRFDSRGWGTRNYVMQLREATERVGSTILSVDLYDLSLHMNRIFDKSKMKEETLKRQIFTKLKNAIISHF